MGTQRNGTSLWSHNGKVVTVSQSEIQKLLASSQKTTLTNTLQKPLSNAPFSSKQSIDSHSSEKKRTITLLSNQSTQPKQQNISKIETHIPSSSSLAEKEEGLLKEEIDILKKYGVVIDPKHVPSKKSYSITSYPIETSNSVETRWTFTGNTGVYVDISAMQLEKYIEAEEVHNSNINKQ